MLLEPQRTEIEDYQKKYIAAWMNILIEGRMGTSFLNRGRVERRLRSFYAELDLEEETEAEARRERWERFAALWIETCVRDRTYSSAAFGMFHLKDETLARKIAAEIDEVTRQIPARLGMEERCRELRRIFIGQYLRMIPQGRENFPEGSEQFS